MKKTMLPFFISWLICLSLFNVMALAMPNEVKSSPSYWTGYIFITLAFAGQLAVSYFSLKIYKSKKPLYGVFLICESYIGLAVIAVIGSCTMLLPGLAVLTGVLVCYAALACCGIILIVTACSAAAVHGIDKKSKSSTLTFRRLCADAEHLTCISLAPEIAAAAKKVYDAIKYSDIVTSHELIEVNEQIQRQFAEFSNAAEVGDAELSQTIAGELLSLIDKRNKMCKLYK